MIGRESHLLRSIDNIQPGKDVIDPVQLIGPHLLPTDVVVPRCLNDYCMVSITSLQSTPQMGDQPPPASVRGSHSAISGNIMTRARAVICISMNGHSAL